MGLPVAVDVHGTGLAEAITSLSSEINVANHRLLRLVAEFDVLGGWREGGAMRSCAHWLAAHCSMTIGAAREKVRVARCLTRLTAIEKAFAGGVLSYSKVRAITRVATPANEAMLVSLAEASSASYLEKLVARYQPVEEPRVAEVLEEAGLREAGNAPTAGDLGLPVQDGGDAEAADSIDGPLVDEQGVEGVGEGEAMPAVDEDERREQAREFYWFQDDDGMWVFHARLPPEEGHLVRRTLEALARPLQEERQAEWNAEHNQRMQKVARGMMRERGEAEAEEVDGAVLASDPETPVGASADGGQPEVPEANARVQYERAEEKISAETFSRFMNQVRADVFVGMVEHFLATAPGYEDLQGLTGADRCQVVLHVDVNTLREQRSGVCCEHGRAHFEEGPWLLPETARRLGCDASLVTVLEDKKGEVLNVGRRSRIVPAHSRRALLERDGVCQYPGCHESRYVDAHHVVHWAEGGETSLDNLVTLCRFHHRQLHRGKFGIEAGKISEETSSGVRFRFVGVG